MRYDKILKKEYEFYVYIMASSSGTLYIGIVDVT